mmetsp:Transcript_1953/g.4253  ORF Transcript_1953/g.4253 Transcript_1953/m.4253 type:complete len:128 (-) Transcript_1953:244-627(-)
MIRFVSVLALLAAVVSTDAFLPSVHRPNMHQIMSSSANEDTDFDAPVLNNPVKASAPKDLDHDILVVDDECYLGKYGQFNECVDFDPMHNVDAQTHAALELPDFKKLGDDISSAIKNSPFGKLFNLN